MKQNICVLDEAQPNNNKNGSKRIKSPPIEGNDLTFTMLFTRAWVDFIHDSNKSVTSVCSLITERGILKLSRQTIFKLSAGTNTGNGRFVYVYKLALMAQAVGLSLMDFIEIKQPKSKNNKVSFSEIQQNLKKCIDK